MAIIALIDDDICVDTLPPCRIRQSFCVRNGMIYPQPLPKPQCDTRASACAQILESLASDYSLVPIHLERTSTAPTEMRDLIPALETCLRLGVDIIGMSLCSTRLSDAALLHPYIRRLTQYGIRVAAPLSRSGHVSVPASLNEVFGVQSDDSQSLEPGEFLWDPHHPLGAQIVANHDFPWIDGTSSAQDSNSLGVPVFVAAMNNWLNAGLDITSQLRKRRREVHFLERTAPRRALPYLYLEQERMSSDFCLSLLNELAHRQQTQTVLLTEQPIHGDIRCFSVAELRMGWPKALHFLERHTASDLILMAAEDMPLSTVVPRLRRKGGQIEFFPRGSAPFTVPDDSSCAAAGVMRCLTDAPVLPSPFLP